MLESALLWRLGTVPLGRTNAGTHHQCSIYVQVFRQYIEETHAFLNTISSEHRVSLLNGSGAEAPLSSQVRVHDSRYTGSWKARNSHACLVDRTDPLTPT